MSINAKNEKIAKLEKALAAEEASHMDTIRHRDFCEEWADKLAYAVAGVDVIGEHSNLNNPWEEAYAIMRSHAEYEILRGAAEEAFAALVGAGARDDSVQGRARIRLRAALGIK